MNAARLAQAVLDGLPPREFLKQHGIPQFRHFRLTFDFGAGEDGYSIYVEVPRELLGDLEDDALTDKVMEYAQETVTDVDRDDWTWLTDVEEVPLGESLPPREFLKGLPTRKLLEVGESVSHATLNPRHLIDAFLSAISTHDPLEHSRLLNDPELSDYLNDQMDQAAQQDFEDNYLNEVLWNVMQDLCPPMTFFGSHPGNGSDFGCWPYESSDYEDLAAEETRVVYAKEGDAALAAEIRQGAFAGTRIEYGIIQTGYMDFECYNSGGKLLWRT